MSSAKILSVRAVRISMDIFRQLKRLHQHAFSDKYLLGTNITISFGLSTVGDVLEQQYERWKGDLTRWDKQRTANMAISGMGVGVICHFWYKLLDRHMPGRSMRVVMKKVVLDQFICSPIYITAFFYTMGMLERKSHNEVWEEMQQKAWRLYAAEWMVWPPAQFINFYWLPSRYRVMYDNMISLGYDIYTSHVKHND